MIDRIRRKMDDLGCEPRESARTSAEGVALIERTIGAELPRAYRDFVVEFGGRFLGTDDFGVEVPIAEPCPEGPTATITSFYDLSDGPRGMLDHWQGSRGNMPPNFLPIAHDLGANAFCLSLGGSDRGAVYFWDLTRREGGGWPELQKIYAELDAAGLDTSRMSFTTARFRWEERNPDKLTKPLYYSNCYRIADSFEQFIEALRPCPR
jgi:hypothetical protein